MVNYINKLRLLQLISVVVLGLLIFPMRSNATSLPASCTLSLTSMCSPEPAKKRIWRVKNSNNKSMIFVWNLYGTSLSGKLTANANSEIYFETPTQPGSNTLTISVNGAQHAVKASTNAACSTPTPTITPTITPTRTPTLTPTHTATATATATFTATYTSTPIPSFTSTPTLTPTSTPTITSTATYTPSATPTQTSTSTPQSTPTIEVLNECHSQETCNCQAIDNQPNQLTLDGLAFQMFRTIVNVNRKKDRKSRLLIAKAKVLYENTWETIWSIKTKTVTCSTNHSSCTTNSLVTTFSTIRTSINQLYKIAQSSIKQALKTRRITKKSALRMTKRINKEYKESSVTLSKLPIEQVSCFE